VNDSDGWQQEGPTSLQSSLAINWDWKVAHKPLCVFIMYNSCTSSTQCTQLDIRCIGWWVNSTMAQTAQLQCTLMVQRRCR